MRILFLLSLSVFLCCQCKKKATNRMVTTAFYHWQTEFKITPTEKAYLDSLQVKKLYIKFFDVDWDFNRRSPEPHASVILNTNHIDKFEIIPTIFITNRTLKNLPDSLVANLAINIYDKIYQLVDPIPNMKIDEVQIDCDWTMNTKAKYFTLLDRLSNLLLDRACSISATIRLHQVKYFEKTGVPPVDRGVLMFYNMGDVGNINTSNSILDLDIAKKYLYNFDQYPLSLDLALPIFSWGVVIRDGKMIKLINQLRAADINDTTRFLKIGENQYQIIKSTYLDGYYLYKDDKIRLESVSYEQLQQATQLLDEVLAIKDLNLIFYHLDHTTIKHFPHENLETLTDILH